MASIARMRHLIEEMDRLIHEAELRGDQTVSAELKNSFAELHEAVKDTQHLIDALRALDIGDAGYDTQKRLRALVREHLDGPGVGGSDA